ncbi:TPA: hypothetical protein ACKP22_003266 [Pseudomonas putida]
MTSFDPARQKAAARRLAKELNFSASEIMTMPYGEMMWWLAQ